MAQFALDGDERQGKARKLVQPQYLESLIHEKLSKVKMGFS
jgi:hypothetical protein